MDKTGQELLNLMFKEGETICVSHNKYGYHSVPLRLVSTEKVTLIPTDIERDFEYVHSDELKLVALNPIHGYRTDANCKAFRNFLIEVDPDPDEWEKADRAGKAALLRYQQSYIKGLAMPYSASVFSGNKSFHYLISLSEDLPSEEVYRTLSEWILAIASEADQNTKNPSRSIRIPGAKRDDKKQLLVDMHGKVSLDQLSAWLGQHPDKKPKKFEARPISKTREFHEIKPWVKKLLKEGLDPNKGRNKQWFTIACEFALAGYSEDEAFYVLEDYFTPDRDFKEREWRTSVRSGFKYIYENRGGRG